jgi:hypothetical protein
MLTLAALVIGSTLTAAGAVDAPSTEPAPEPPVVTPLERRTERHRRRMAKVHTFAGFALEAGAGLFHAWTAAVLISDDLRCDGSDATCRTPGSPLLLALPLTASALGWVGATRFAAARDATVWRSELFWAGTVVTVTSYIAAAAFSLDVNGRNNRDQRLGVDIAFVAGSLLGNVIQVWGALTAPARDAAAGTRPLSLAPGCGPISGGLVCGLALAGF